MWFFPFAIARELIISPLSIQVLALVMEMCGHKERRNSDRGGNQTDELPASLAAVFQDVTQHLEGVLRDILKDSCQGD